MRQQATGIRMYFDGKERPLNVRYALQSITALELRQTQIGAAEKWLVMAMKHAITKMRVSSLSLEIGLDFQVLHNVEGRSNW